METCSQGKRLWLSLYILIFVSLINGAPMSLEKLSRSGQSESFYQAGDPSNRQNFTVTNATVSISISINLFHFIDC